MRVLHALLAAELISLALLVGVRTLRWPLGIAPRAAWKALNYRAQDDEFGELLRADLDTIGLARLDGRVQCLDTFSGCIRVLYDLRLRQSTGTLYDEFLFGPVANRIVEGNQADFMRELSTRPPRAIVVTPQEYSIGKADYAKIGEWPDFAEYFQENYSLCAERVPTRPRFWEGSQRVPVGYRIYLSKSIWSDFKGQLPDSVRICSGRPAP